jgi:ring-1,2-phenylacetyl-CoA epoxidase subunit PaaC
MISTSLLLDPPPIDVVDPTVATVALGVSDDEFVIGHRHSEWLGLSPFLEEDLTLASIAQDELGHARALYALLWPSWDDRDSLLVRRPATHWRCCELVEQGGLSWEGSFIRQLTYDIIEPHRWQGLADMWHDPQVDALVDRVLAEEQFHRRHVVDIVTRLCRAGDEPLARLQRSVVDHWPLVNGLLSDLNPTFRASALSDLHNVVTSAGLTVPRTREGDGDRSARSGAFNEVQASLVSVIAFDPEATW